MIHRKTFLLFIYESPYKSRNSICDWNSEPRQTLILKTSSRKSIFSSRFRCNFVCRSFSLLIFLLNKKDIPSSDIFRFHKYCLDSLVAEVVVGKLRSGEGITWGCSWCFIRFNRPPTTLIESENSFSNGELNPLQLISFGRTALKTFFI